MACPITVTFTGKTNDDIFDNLSVLASTGQIDIPLQCTSKKALPHVDTPVVNIGNVVMGESGTANLQITNKVCKPQENILRVCSRHAALLFFLVLCRGRGRARVWPWAR